jgi:hypothetical protein
MLEAYADCSYDNDLGVLAAGYIVYELDQNERTMVETGNRVLNTNADTRPIDWCSNRGEYWATIVTARAVLGYTDQPIMLYTDADSVYEAVVGDDPYEDYFSHALKSFLHRFNNYYIRSIDRENNEIAHDQARLGLKIGRDILRDNE